MTEEQKQSLANDLTAYIGQPLNNPMTRSQWMEIARIALAALTAQPVVSPHEWVHIRLTDRSKNQRMKCQVAWSDWLNSVIYDEEGAPLLISNSAFEVIRAAGYEVQE